MSRLDRFGDFRFIGVRDTMLAFDCDDEEQFAELESLVGEKDLRGRDLVSTFAPDTAVEARNRGFTLRR